MDDPYKIPGRAYTPQRKLDIIERLYRIWLDAPTLRLGQLIYAGTPPEQDLFYVEDEDLIANLRKVVIPADREQP